MFNKSIFYDTDFGGIISFLDFEEIGVFAHEVCGGSAKRQRWEVGIFIWELAHKEK